VSLILQAADPEVLAKARAGHGTLGGRPGSWPNTKPWNKTSKGALLRREGIYSSLISAWRLQRD
jgi:transposase